jgi:hypothetical protein
MFWLDVLADLADIDIDDLRRLGRWLRSLGRRGRHQK